jgi:WD40 repeat protein
MKINKISTLILAPFLFGCSLIPESVSMPARSEPTSLTIHATNTYQSTAAPKVSSTPTSTILPESTTPEITTTTDDNQTILKGFKPDIIRWLFWSKDGKALTIGTQESGVILYDLVNKKVTANFENGPPIIQDLALSPDEKTLAVVIYATDSIRLVNPETGNLMKTLYITGYWPGGPGGLAFSPDSKVLASANHKDREIILWEVATGKEITRLFTSDYWIGKLSFSPDGKSLMASSWYTTFRVWDTNTWKLQRTFGGDSSGFSFSADGSKFATFGRETQEPVVWDFDNGKKLFDLSNTQPKITAITYDPSGKYIAVSGANGGNTTIDTTITIYDANTGKHLREFVTGYHTVTTTLAFSPDGTKLASAGLEENPGEVTIWDMNQP